MQVQELISLLTVLSSVSSGSPAPKAPEAPPHGAEHGLLPFIGCPVLIRSSDSGVWVGTCQHSGYTPAGLVCVMKDARRVWSWEGAAELSQIANTGTVGSGSRIASKCSPVVVGVCEVHFLTEANLAKLHAHPEWVK